MTVRVFHALALFVLLAADAAPAAARRVALVIGNGAYAQTVPLPNPPRDARSMAAAFARLGFDVVEGVNLSRTAMEGALREFGNAARGAEVAVVYFAGHGLQVAGQNYLIPVDAELKREQDLRYEAIPASAFLDEARGATRLRLVILDACRENPFVRKLKSAVGATRSVAVGSGLRLIEEVGPDTLVAYATATDAVADDGTGGHSPYTDALLQHIETPGLEINLLFGRVRDTVMRRTDNRQQPFTYGSLGGEPIFLRNPQAVASAPPAAAAAARPAAGIDPVELAFWDSVRQSTSAGDYRAYLEAFPEGRFAPLARARIAAYAPSAATARPAEAGTAADLPTPASPPIAGIAPAPRPASAISAAPRVEAPISAPSGGASSSATSSPVTETARPEAPASPTPSVAVPPAPGPAPPPTAASPPTLPPEKSTDAAAGTPPAPAPVAVLPQAEPRAPPLPSAKPAAPPRPVVVAEAPPPARVEIPPAAVRAPPPFVSAPPTDVPPAPVQEARVPAVPPPRPEPRSCPAPGTRIVTSVGDMLTFVAGEGFRCGVVAPGAARQVVAFAAGPEGRSIEWQGRAPTSPLQPGARFGFISRGMGEGGPSAWYHDFTVREARRARVAAGEFDVLVIREQRTGWGGNDYEAELVHWFAPELGFDVKQEVVKEYRNRSNSPLNRGAPQLGPLGGRGWEATQVLPPD